jgi:hypothetical protein
LDQAAVDARASDGSENSANVSRVLEIVQETRNVDTNAHVIDIPDVSVCLTVQAPADAAIAVENIMDWDFQGSGNPS